MADEKEKNWNRSSNFTPEELAVILKEQAKQTQELIALAVAEAMKSFAPALAGAIREGNKPFVDPVAEARKAREKQEFKEAEDERVRNERARKENCSHQYPNNQWSCSQINNYLDHHARYVCMRCQELFEPPHWEIAATVAEAAQLAAKYAPQLKGITPPFQVGKAYMVPAHPKYITVANALANQQQANMF